MKKTLTILLINFLVSGFVFAAAPKWITEPYSVYPRDKYIVAVGEGSSKLSAQNKALNEITSFFGQSVESKITASEKFRNSVENNSSTTSSKSFLDKDLEVTVNQDDLLGIEYPEFYQDKKHNDWYVIGVMDIKKACDIYTNKIIQNEKTISILMDYTSKESLTYISRVKQALLIAIENEKMNTRMYLMNSNSKLNITEAVKLKTELKLTAEQLPIYVHFTNDDNTIASLYKELLKSEAFELSEDVNSKYRLEGTVEYLYSKSDDSTTSFCEARIKSQLVDTVTGDIYSPMNLTTREGAKNEELAKNRAIKTIQKKIKESFTL